MNGLKSKRSKTDDSLAICAINQCIMHMVVKHYVPQIQVAIGTEVHTRSDSQLLIDILHKFGFSSSPAIVRQFERNAAQC